VKIFPIVYGFLQLHIKRYHTISMSDPSIQAMTCIKEVIQALDPECKKELFKHFVTHLSNCVPADRPSTPVATIEPNLPALKRLLNSPESSHRSKKNNKVFQYLWKFINFSREKNVLVKLLF
jgi:hypothetical protein